MTNAYLDLAERVLSGAEGPLSAREILRRGYEAGVMPEHLHGRTQHKTLQARISVDIAVNSDRSRFFRSEPGKFYLRARREFVGMREFPAKPRWLDLRRGFVLVVQSALLGCLADGPIPLDDLKEPIAAASYISERTVESNKASLLPVASFVVLHREGLALSRRNNSRTGWSNGSSRLRTFGFGSAVLAQDFDILYDSYSGVVESGIRALSRAVRLPRSDAERARYNNSVQKHFGLVTTDDAGNPNGLNIVLSFKCPDLFDPLDNVEIPDARWASDRDFGNDISDYDHTSRVLVEDGGLRAILRS